MCFPPYSFSMGVLNFTMIMAYEYKNKTNYNSAFDWDISLKYLVFLVSSGVVYFLFLFIMELKNYSNLRYKKKTNKKVAQFI